MTTPKRYISRWTTRGQHIDPDAVPEAVRVVRHFARMADSGDPHLEEAGLRGLAYVAKHFVKARANTGRPQATHRGAWLTLFDEVRATPRGAHWSRPRIVNAIYRDCRDEHGRRVKFETVRRFIAKHRK